MNEASRPSSERVALAMLACAVLATAVGCKPTQTCTDECAGKVCGGDGCVGSCGSCPTGDSCNATGKCVTRTIPPSTLTYSDNPATYARGLAIAANRPSSSGGAVVSYSVSPSLPAGLSVDTGTGAITGTPTTVTATTSYLITATNSAGDTTAWVSITVSDAEPGDAGLRDAGADDGGPGDAGSVDAGPYDAGPGDAGPSSTCDGTAVIVTAGAWQVRLAKATGELTFSGPDLDGAAQATVIRFVAPGARVAGTWHSLGRVLACRVSGDSVEVIQELDGQPAVARLSAPHPEVLRYEVTDWGALTPERTSLTVFSGADEHFYGFGEKFDSLDQAGLVVRTLTFDAPGDKGDHSYTVAPWFVSTRGYGFHLDSTAESSFDLRATAADRYVVTNLASHAARSTSWTAPASPTCCSRYTGYTGRPPLPPPWAFGPWISSDVWRDGRRGSLRRHASSRERGIPGSVFVFDSPWETRLQRLHLQHDPVRRGRNVTRGSTSPASRRSPR